MPKYTGAGSSIAKTGGNPWVGRVASIGVLRFTCPELDDTALDSVDYEEVVPSDLLRIEELPITVLLGDQDLPSSGSGKAVAGKSTLGTYTITFDNDTNTTITGSGYLSAVGTPQLTPQGRKSMEFVLKFDGKVGPSWNAGP